jgi:hypothetical protein
VTEAGKAGCQEGCGQLCPVGLRGALGGTGDAHWICGQDVCLEAGYLMGCGVEIILGGVQCMGGEGSLKMAR